MKILNILKNFIKQNTNKILRDAVIKQNTSQIDYIVGSGIPPEMYYLCAEKNLEKSYKTLRRHNIPVPEDMLIRALKGKANFSADLLHVCDVNYIDANGENALCQLHHLAEPLPMLEDMLKLGADIYQLIGDGLPLELGGEHEHKFSRNFVDFTFSKTFNVFFANHEQNIAIFMRLLDIIPVHYSHTKTHIVDIRTKAFIMYEKQQLMLAAPKNTHKKVMKL